jgi:hypothetical protein
MPKYNDDNWGEKHRNVHIYWSDIKGHFYTNKQIQSFSNLSCLPRRNYLCRDDETRHITGLLLAEWGRRHHKQSYSISNNTCWVGMRQKPEEKPTFNNVPLEFSISHSNDIVICAIGDHPLGIDIEKVEHSILDLMLHIAKTEEFVWLHSQNCSLNNQYQLWTYKESYLKCIGSNISKICNIYPMIHNNQLINQHDIFRFKSLSIRPEYVATICTTFRIGTLSVEEIELQCLISNLLQTVSLN